MKKETYTAYDTECNILFVENSLPIDFPPSGTVYYYYNKWKCEGLLDEIHDHLREGAREKAGKTKTPTAACIDSSQ